MRFHALACDYDGTVAKRRYPRRSDPPRPRAPARDRAQSHPGHRAPDRGSEGGLSRSVDLRRRRGRERRGPLLAREEGTARARRGAAAAFAERLSRAGVREVAVGHVIVATWQPYELMVLDAIRDLGLELQVIFNKGAVMVLPTGVNKGTGLRAALEELGLSPHNAVGVGDAENDHALLAACECGVAVANALPVLKERADLVTVAERGAGVAELAGRLIDDDLASVADRLARHDLPIGTDASNKPVALPADGARAPGGDLGGGKSTFATAFFERLDERAYGYCIVDPEGDYSELPHAIVIGSRQSAPDLDDVMKALDRPAQGLVMNLLGVPLQIARRSSARSLPAAGVPGALRPPALADHRRGAPPGTPHRAGRRGRAGLRLQEPLSHHRSPRARGAVHAVGRRRRGRRGREPPRHLARDRGSSRGARPEVSAGPPEGGRGAGVVAATEWRGPRAIQTIAPETERRRHVRKYATGELPVENSFYFRGPEAKLNLRAQNLMSFLQIAEGVDDATWLFHLRAGDYSRWLTSVIKDEASGRRDRRHREGARERPRRAGRERRPGTTSRRPRRPRSLAAPSRRPSSASTRLPTEPHRAEGPAGRWRFRAANRSERRGGAMRARSRRPPARGRAAPTDFPNRRERRSCVSSRVPLLSAEARLRSSARTARSSARRSPARDEAACDARERGGQGTVEECPHDVGVDVALAAHGRRVPQSRRHLLDGAHDVTVRGAARRGRLRGRARRGPAGARHTERV